MLGMIADHRRNLGRVVKIETLPIFPICLRPFRTIGDVYDFPLVGKVWGDREIVKSPIDRLGFSRHIKTRFSYIIIWQGSLEVNPRVLIGSFLVGILPYGPFPWKRS